MLNRKQKSTLQVSRHFLQNGMRLQPKGWNEFQQVYERDHKIPASITFHHDARPNSELLKKDEKWTAEKSSNRKGISSPLVFFNSLNFVLKGRNKSRIHSWCAYRSRTTGVKNDRRGSTIVNYSLVRDRGVVVSKWKSWWSWVRSWSWRAIFFLYKWVSERLWRWSDCFLGSVGRAIEGCPHHTVLVQYWGTAYHTSTTRVRAWGMIGLVIPCYTLGFLLGPELPDLERPPQHQEGSGEWASYLDSQLVLCLNLIWITKNHPRLWTDQHSHPPSVHPHSRSIIISRVQNLSTTPDTAAVGEFIRPSHKFHEGYETMVICNLWYKPKDIMMWEHLYRQQIQLRMKWDVIQNAP